MEFEMGKTNNFVKIYSSKLKGPFGGPEVFRNENREALSV
jgi:hypothetical protein